MLCAGIRAGHQGVTDNLWYGHLQAAMNMQQESNFVSFPFVPDHYFEYQRRIYGEMQRCTCRVSKDW